MATSVVVYVDRRVLDMVNINDDKAKGDGWRVESTDSKSKRGNGAASSYAGIVGFSDTVERVIRGGGYISFGRSSDGGVNVIRVLDGNRKLTRECRTRGDILQALTGLDDMYAEGDDDIGIVADAANVVPLNRRNGAKAT